MSLADSSSSNDLTVLVNQLKPKNSKNDSKKMAKSPSLYHGKMLHIFVSTSNNMIPKRLVKLPVLRLISFSK
jgi:hypothetical protein